ncbi:hypothetical protein Tco_0151131 [Tanacetum coccineum]
MTTLADKSLLSGGDNKPPMLEKHLYDSWKSRMELYMMNRPHGRMILASVEKGPLVWPSITEDGVTRLKEYVELTPAEAIQADCDIKAINIILQGLPTEIYALVSQHRVAKDLWEKIKLLMQGTSLTKQERECKLYDEFDKFTYKKGETLHEYYLRFTLLLNDMNIYKMPLEQFQVNTKFLNTLPDEWSKFVTDVKLVKDLHTTNVDQLHAYLQQHERHANEVRLMHERNPDPLALVASHQLTQPAYQSHLHTHPKSLSQLYVSPYQSSQFVTPYQTQQFTTNQSTPLSITYPLNKYQSTVHHNIYSSQPSIPQMEYAPTTYQQQQPEFSQPDFGLVVLVFQKGDDPIDLRISSNPHQQATIYDGKVTVQPVQGRFRDSLSCESFPRNGDDATLRKLSEILQSSTQHDVMILSSCETVNECQRCLELKTELLNKKDFVDKETYDKLSQSQAKDTVIVKSKEKIKSLNGNVDDSTVKMDMDEIETLNIELEHRVTKLVTENEHLKQTYKQLYDSIKPKRVQSKEQCDALIKQVNIKSGEISDLNAKLQVTRFGHGAIKIELRKLKDKALDKGGY